MSNSGDPALCASAERYDMAAYAYHALALGYSDDEVNRFFCEGLFAVGDELTVEQLLPTVLKVGEINLRCMEELGKITVESVSDDVLSRFDD